MSLSDFYRLSVPPRHYSLVYVKIVLIYLLSLFKSTHSCIPFFSLLFICWRIWWLIRRLKITRLPYLNIISQQSWNNNTNTTTIGYYYWNYFSKFLYAISILPPWKQAFFVSILLDHNHYIYSLSLLTLVNLIFTKTGGWPMLPSHFPQHLYCTPPNVHACFSEYQHCCNAILQVKLEMWSLGRIGVQVQVLFLFNHFMLLERRCF